MQPPCRVQKEWPDDSDVNDRFPTKGYHFQGKFFCLHIILPRDFKPRFLSPALALLLPDIFVIVRLYHGMFRAI